MMHHLRRSPARPVADHARARADRADNLGTVSQHQDWSFFNLPEKSYNDTLLNPCLTRMNSGPRMTEFPRTRPRPAEGAIHLPCMRSPGHLDSGSMLACLAAESVSHRQSAQVSPACRRARASRAS